MSIVNQIGTKVAVIGLATSGIAVAEVLKTYGISLYGFDKKPVQRPDLFEAVFCEIPANGELSDAGGAPIRLDSAVISPGVPLDSDFAKYFSEASIPLIGEIELAYFLTNSAFLAITGTNGKTTTTSLVGEIMKRHNPKAEVCGNIGIPATTMAASTQDAVLVAEISSFQLETMHEFRCKIAAILNITPDHLDRHGDMETYVALKKKLGTLSETVVLNADDPILSAMTWGDQRVTYFSRLREVHGAFVRGDAIYCFQDYICKVSEIPLVGKHNIENVLAAVLMTYLYGVPVDQIRAAILEFQAVEHRIEYVRTIERSASTGGSFRIDFFNDSKGTNPDSTIKAIDSFEDPIHLIAGGFERSADFHPMLLFGRGKIASLSLLGATAVRLRDAAVAVGYDKVRICMDMRAAVQSAYDFAVEQGSNAWKGGRSIVLLSPACASWGMYENYMKRGEEFKELVRKLD